MDNGTIGVDMDFFHAQEAIRRNILAQNRALGEIYESAQFLYLLVAAGLFSKYRKRTFPESY